MRIFIAENLSLPEMKKSRKSSTSALECLNDDLVEFCILPRLPVSSLMRFKCVSKKWHRWISTPNPCLVQTQIHYASSGILLHSRSVYSYNPDSPSLYLYNYISKDTGNVNIPKSNGDINELGSQIRASCNGIVCIANLILQKIFIGNPFLKDWKQLPYRSGLSEKFWGMAVDVGENSMCFKLVVSKEIWINGNLEREFHIFSSKSGQWKVVQKRIGWVASSSDIGVYVMGSMYWRFRRYLDYLVLRFRFEDEESRFLPLPREAKDGKIGDCSGKLSYTVFRDGKIEIWYLVNSQWSKSISIKFENCIQRKLRSLVPPSHTMQLRRKKPYSVPYQVNMLPFEGGDVIPFSVDGAIYFCDTRTSKIREQHVNDWHPRAVFPYRNTILPLPEKFGIGS